MRAKFPGLIQKDLEKLFTDAYDTSPAAVLYALSERLEWRKK